MTAEDAEKVTEQTGGWAAGIVLTANTPTASGIADAGETGEQSTLFDYLTTEVFDRLPNSLQQFLLRTSILREFTASICDSVLGISNSDRQIDQIKHMGLFLEERTGEFATFAYHDLFREYLERRFQLEFRSDYEMICRRAAYLYRELGDDDAAIYHFLQIDEAGEVAGIVKQASGAYFDQRGWGKLAVWLDRLPSSVLDSDPELLLLGGRILAIRAGDPTGALERFDKVLASDPSHNPEIVGKTLVAKSTAYRRLGDLARAVKAAKDGLEVLENIECSPDQIAEAHRQIGSALATGGDLELGRQHFQTALQQVSPDNMSLISLICDGLAVACIELGQLDQAAVHLEHARTGWLKLRSEGPLAESLINLALVYYHQGEFDLAFDEAAEALRVAEASGYPRLVATALVRQAAIQQALGQNEDALASSSRALELARKLLDQRLIAESTNNIGHAYWKMGEVSKAEVLLNQALLQADESGQNYIIANYHINLGKVYCHESSYDQALGHLNKALELLADYKSIARDAEANIYLVLSQQSFERISLLRKWHAERASAAKYPGRGYPLPHQILRFAQNDTS